MSQNPGVRTTFMVLLVVAAVIVLVGWFMWSLKARKPVPTSPARSSQLIAPLRPLTARAV